MCSCVEYPLSQLPSSQSLAAQFRRTPELSHSTFYLAPKTPPKVNSNRLILLLTRWLLFFAFQIVSHLGCPSYAAPSPSLATCPVTCSQYATHNFGLPTLSVHRFYHPLPLHIPDLVNPSKQHSQKLHNAVYDSPSFCFCRGAVLGRSGDGDCSCAIFGMLWR